MSKNLLLRLIALVWGSFSITLVFFVRFIRVRIPKEVYIEPFSELFYLYLVLAFLSFLIVIFALYKLLKIKPKENGIIVKLYNFKFIRLIVNKALFFLEEVVIKGPEKVYQIFYDHYRFFIKFNFSSYRLLCRNKYLSWHTNGGKQIYFCLVTIPKIIVATMFFVDVYYFHYFSFFYKSLVLLIFPLIVNLWLFFIEYSGETYYHHLCAESIDLNYIKSKDEGYTIEFRMKDGDWEFFDYRTGKLYPNESDHVHNFILEHIQLAQIFMNLILLLKNFTNFTKIGRVYTLDYVIV